ncbi:MAG: hypothetical protein AAF581_17750 [Planctomycetota bacterium]
MRCDHCGTDDNVSDHLVELRSEIRQEVQDLSSRFKTIPLCEDCFGLVRLGVLTYES